MSFDLEKFHSTKFTLPVSDVDVPELKAFFGPEEKPVWRVRMLRGREWAKAEAAKNGRHQRVIEELVAGLHQGDAQGISKRFLGAIGMDSGVDPEMVRNRYIFLAGSVRPKPTLKDVNTISEYFIVPFARVVRRIMELSGRGPNIQGELSASGQAPECREPLHSAPEASEGEADSGSSSR